LQGQIATNNFRVSLSLGLDLGGQAVGQFFALAISPASSKARPPEPAPVQTG
jgi:hypothetical protein